MGQMLKPKVQAQTQLISNMNSEIHINQFLNICNYKADKQR